MKLKFKPGITIVEVIMAIAILVIGIVAIVSIFPTGMKLTKEGENLTIATQQAQGQMEELNGSNYDALGIGTVEAKHRLSQSETDNLYNFQRQTVVSYVDPNLNLNQSLTDQNLKKIVVTVFWPGRFTQPEKTYSLTTLISKQ